MFRDAFGTGTSRYVGRIYLALGILLFIVGEALAIVTVIRGRELHLPSIDLMPFFICLPLIVCFHTYRRIKKRLTTGGVDEDAIADIWSSLVYATALAYVPIVWSTALLLFALRSMIR
jgi:hypothetical protein